MNNILTASTANGHEPAPLQTDDVTMPLPEHITPVSARSLLTGLLGSLAETRKKNLAGEWTGGIRCGVPLIDNNLRGLRRRSVSYLLAPPNIGKSTLANQIAGMVAAYPAQSVAALYLSYENPPEDLLLKQLARLSGWKQDDLLSGEVDPVDPHLAAGVAALQRLPLYYLDGDPKVKYTDVLAAVETVKADSGADDVFVVLDYLQYFAKCSTVKETRYEQINEAVVCMRELAILTAAHVMVISSQNRETNKQQNAESRSPKDTNNTPTIHGGTGSGDIEYDADLILVLEVDGSFRTLTAAKTRYGGKNASLKMTFDEDRATFAWQGQTK